MKKIIMFVALTLIAQTSQAATSFTEQQVREFAARGLDAYNTNARAKGYSEERLFEGYSKVETNQCEEKGSLVECKFWTTEAQDRDQDVYSPNQLTVKIDQATGQVSVEIEFGC